MTIAPRSAWLKCPSAALVGGAVGVADSKRQKRRARSVPESRDGNFSLKSWSPVLPPPGNELALLCPRLFYSVAPRERARACFDV